MSATTVPSAGRDVPVYVSSPEGPGPFPGGGLALLLAPERGFAASSVNYGSALPGAYSPGFLRTACPIVGSFGALDPTPPGAARRLEGALTEVHVYHERDGAGGPA